MCTLGTSETKMQIISKCFIEILGHGHDRVSVHVRFHVYVRGCCRYRDRVRERVSVCCGVRVHARVRGRVRVRVNVHCGFRDRACVGECVLFPFQCPCGRCGSEVRFRGLVIVSV